MWRRAMLTAAGLLLAISLEAVCAQPQESDFTTAIAAEEAWSPVRMLIRASVAPWAQSGSYYLPPPARDDYREWMNSARALLRTVGQSFYDRHPRDRRRWEWLVATIAFPPPEAALSDAARAEWAAAFARMKVEMLVSPQASEAQRMEVVLADMNARYRAERKAGRVDWERWRREVLAAAAIGPQFSGTPLRSFANRVLDATRKHDSDTLGGFLTALRESPNQLLRNLALAGEAYARARTEPMQMRFTAIDGREVDLAALRGKVVLIDFWAATWCGVCRHELPALRELYGKYRNDGFEMIGITHDMHESDKAFVLQYLKEHQVSWPQYFDGRGMNNPYAQRFGIVGIPQYFLLGRNGLLVWDRKRGGGIGKLETVVREQLGLP